MNFNNVLVVEDEPFHFKIVSRLLAALSITNVSHAENGVSAIKMIEEGEDQYDLILCDYQLGDVTGVEVLSKAREIPAYQNTPIIVMTAEKESNIAVEASEAGATLFLKKPFSGATFKERLEMALDTVDEN